MYLFSTDLSLLFGDDMSSIIKKAKAMMLLHSPDSEQYKQAHQLLKSLKDDNKGKTEKKRGRNEECK